MKFTIYKFNRKFDVKTEYLMKMSKDAGGNISQYPTTTFLVNCDEINFQCQFSMPLFAKDPIVVDGLVSNHLEMEDQRLRNTDLTSIQSAYYESVMNEISRLALDDESTARLIEGVDGLVDSMKIRW